MNAHFFKVLSVHSSTYLPQSKCFSLSILWCSKIGNFPRVESKLTTYETRK
jgi:hypothetical protein